ncbi:MAG: DNA replication/repair protein RecF [Nevskia sp.]
MHFRSARARHFRLLRDEQFELHPKLNYFVGGNAAGKTTVLEALHVLGRASSHRGAAQTLVSDGETAWSLEAAVASEGQDAPPVPVQVRWAGRRLSIELNHRSASLAELVRLVPILVLDPFAHRIIDEGPGIRRRYIDWGVFHMEQQFHPLWTRMNRALKQRNAGLRSQASSRELSGWNRELAAAAVQITAMRVRYVEKLRETVSAYWSSLLGHADWTLRFQSGWKDAQDYLDVLQHNQESDRKLGYTREGPHRAELLILSDNTQLRDRISRGQQKLLVAALILAQSDLYRQQHGSAPVLLVDDFAAELSSDSQKKLLCEFEAYAGQKIIAALDYSEAMRAAKDHYMFHMEHGHITAMTQTT